ncbi:MAG: hypothetical protein KH282_09740, partial [Clostridiales bacterium]|nr:hypothetical protein [Clostridiales bacterium]
HFKRAFLLSPKSHMAFWGPPKYCPRAKDKKRKKPHSCAVFLLLQYEIFCNATYFLLKKNNKLFF